MSEYYPTSDTAKATFLVAAGYKIQHIDYSQPRFAFMFVDSPAIRELANQYLIGTGLVEPSKFNRINKKLLRIINYRRQWEDD